MATIRQSDTSFDPWAQFARDAALATSQGSMTDPTPTSGVTKPADGIYEEPTVLAPGTGNVVAKPVTMVGVNKLVGPAAQPAIASAQRNVALPAQAVLRALARGGSSAEATVRDRGDERKSSLPGGKRTRRRAEFGVQGGTPYRTGVSIK